MSRVTEQFEQAQQYLAGGVSASTRVNRALGHPLYIDRAEGTGTAGARPRLTVSSRGLSAATGGRLLLAI